MGKFIRVYFKRTAYKGTEFNLTQHMIDLFLCGIKQANDMDNVIRSASMKQRQRVTQKQCRHTHTRTYNTHTNTHNTHARTQTLSCSLSLALSKNESVKRGPQQSQFYDKRSPILYARGSGHRGCASIIITSISKQLFFFCPNYL